MGLTEQERRIELDYDRATAHANKYIMPFVLQVEARASMIESAARKFQGFCELPAMNSTVLAFLDFAWTIVSTVVPAVSLVSLVRKARIAEELTTASSAVRMVLVQNTKPGRITKGTEIVGKVKEVGGGIYEKEQTLVNGSESGMDRLAKLDTTKGPIKELFGDAKRMVDEWNKTIDFLIEEKSARLANPKTYPKTMFSYATERLPTPEFFSDSDLDQIEAEYLWNMIARYCRENADFSEAKNGYAIHKGLNDTQISTIFALFGPGVPRGRYFNRPFFLNVIYYLHAFGAQPRANGFDYRNTSWKTGPGHLKP